MGEEKTQIAFDWGNIAKVFGSVLALSVLVFGAIFFMSKFGKMGQDNTMDDLVIEDIQVGDGEEVAEGDTVTVHYTGAFLDGAKFDSSVDREPFTFIVGSGEVIEGWDKGLLGMKKGGKRKLTIPPDLAYGSEGVGEDIPPNSTLVFEIELLEIKK